MNGGSKVHVMNVKDVEEKAALNFVKACMPEDNTEEHSGILGA